MHEKPGVSPDVLSVEPKGVFGEVRYKIAKYVAGSRVPNKDYESSVLIFGATLGYNDEGKIIWDNRGVMPKIDATGDWLLRLQDDHVAKDPVKILRREPRKFLGMLASGPKRYRGNAEEVAANAKRLGLEKYYGLHPQGIEVLSPDVYEHGIALQDIWRQDLINSELLLGFDRFEALIQATEYVKAVHQRADGGIGELLTSDIFFKRNEQGELVDPVLNIPDIVWNKGKNISPVEQKAIDLFDFAMCVSVEELRRNPDPAAAKKVYETIIKAYGDPQVIKTLRSFARRGRLTLEGNQTLLQRSETITTKHEDKMAVHNTIRMRVPKEEVAALRTALIDSCSDYLAQSSHQ